MSEAAPDFSADLPPPEPERACPNCGAALKGPYCYHCGQPTRSFIKFFPALVREVAADTVSYDSRLWRTLKPLMLRPGFLSHEYVYGRRARYTPPFRLYIVSSLLAFLMVTLMVNSAEFRQSDGLNREAPAVDEHGPEETGTDDDTAASPTSRPRPEWNINLGNGNWDPATNPIELTWLGAAGNRWLNRRIERIRDNSQIIRDDPGRFMRTLVSLLPQMMFVVLPVFAMLVALLYLFSGRYYVEHLILQVHNHAFVFLVMILLWLLSLAGEAFEARTMPGANALSWIFKSSMVVVQIWVPIYLFLSMKRFYRQGWIMTTLKFSILSVVYFTLLIFAFTFTAVIGMLRL